MIKNNQHVRNEAEVNSQLCEICSFICSNCVELKRELESIKQTLDNASVYGIAYSNSKKAMIELHLKQVYSTKDEFATLELLFKKLENLEKNSSLELTQGIDFVNIYEALINQNTIEDIMFFAMRGKRVLNNIVFQLDRILSYTNDIGKQIAILKGMIAYY